MTKPFKRGPFKDLPETPTVPHVFFESEGLSQKLNSKHFGPMTAHVRRTGSGPPLLLVHGLMTSSYSWRYVFQELGAHFTCYAPDLPGAGRSDGPLHCDYQPQSLASWLIEVQRALGIYGCPIIGNSMGGYIAMHLALKDEQACSKLINLHSPGVPELRLYALKAALSIPGTHALLKWWMARDPLKWAHANVHYYDESLKSLEEAREYGDVLSGAPSNQAFIKYLSETMSPGPMKDFHKVLSIRKDQSQPFPVPLRLIYAAQDPMVPPRFGKIFHDLIPGSEYIELNNASHFAHVDNPRAFLDASIGFLTDS
jgi:pimeloyl-ACP methyl ester carboxylesterase